MERTQGRPSRAHLATQCYRDGVGRLKLSFPFRVPVPRSNVPLARVHSGRQAAAHTYFSFKLLTAQIDGRREVQQDSQSSSLFGTRQDRYISYVSSNLLENGSSQQSDTQTEGVEWNTLIQENWLKPISVVSSCVRANQTQLQNAYSWQSTQVPNSTHSFIKNSRILSTRIHSVHKS